MTRAQHAVASPRVVNIEDLRIRARARLPKSVFDYLDGGAEDEVTLQCGSLRDARIVRQSFRFGATTLDSDF